MTAIEQGIARRPLSENELRGEVKTEIPHMQTEAKALTDVGTIPPPAWPRGLSRDGDNVQPRSRGRLRFHPAPPAR